MRFSVAICSCKTQETQWDANDRTRIDIKKQYSKMSNDYLFACTSWPCAAAMICKLTQAPVVLRKKLSDWSWDFILVFKGRNFFMHLQVIFTPTRHTQHGNWQQVNKLVVAMALWRASWEMHVMVWKKNEYFLRFQSQEEKQKRSKKYW